MERLAEGACLWDEIPTTRLDRLSCRHQAWEWEWRIFWQIFSCYNCKRGEVLISLEAFGKQELL